MSKRPVSNAIVSSSSSSDSDSGSDVDWGSKKSKNAAAAAKKRPKLASVSSKSSSDNSDSELDVPKKPDTVTPMPKKKIFKKASSDSEAEEGQASSSSSDEADEELADGLDDDLMGDDEDRLKLADMTEKEREEELFNRAERREAMRARQAVKKRLKEAKEKGKLKQALPIQRPSAGVSERKKVLEMKKSASASKFKELLERRQKQKQKEVLKASEVFSSDEGSSSDSDSGGKVNESKSKPRGSLTSDSSSDSGGRSSGSDSDDEEERRKRLQEIEDAKEMEMDQLPQLRLSRHKMELWCAMPFFTDLATGLFVRVGIGHNDGVSIYRVAQIEQVVETAKVYQLGTTRTNKGFLLRLGNDKKMYRLEFISNSDFLESEIQYWKKKMIESNLDLPTKGFVKQKKEEITKAINYKLTDERELEKIVDEKRRFKKAPPNFAVKKTQLMKQKEAAEQEGDHAQAQKVQDEIDSVEQRAVELDQRRTNTIKSISYINERNRQRNLEQAEEAFKREVREIADMQKEGGDPFMRRMTRPNIMTNKKRQSAGGPGASASPAAPSPLVIPKPASQPPDRKSLLTALSPTKKAPGPPPAEEKSMTRPPSDVWSIHDFDIDIDIGVGLGNSSNATPAEAEANDDSLCGGNTASSRRSLNLDEYKKLRGLI